MGKSIFDGLLQFKMQLASSLQMQNGVLKSLSDVLLSEDSADIREWEDASIDQTLTIHNNETVTMKKMSGAPEIMIQLDAKDAEGNALTTQRLVYINELIDADLSDYVSTSDNGELFKTKWTDILTSLKEGIDINEFYSTANDLWMKSTKVDAVSFNGICQSYERISSTNLFKSDLESIRRTMLSSSQNNSISNFTWLSYLNNVMSDSKKNIEDQQSLLATSENPFAVTTFCMTVIQAVVEGFFSVLSAIGLIFGNLFGVLGSILIGVWNGLKSLFNTEWEIKPESSYPGIYGTFIAGSAAGDENIYEECLNLEYMDISKIYRAEFVGVDAYWYRFYNSTADKSQVVCQYQPVLNAKFEEVARWVRANVNLEGATLGYSLVIPENFVPFVPNYAFLNESEYYEQFSDIEVLKRNVYASILASIFAIIHGGHWTDVGSDTLIKAILDCGSDSPSIGNNDIKNLYQLALSMYNQCFGKVDVAYDDGNISHSLILRDIGRSILIRFTDDRTQLTIREAFVDNADYVSFIPSDDCVRIPDVSVGSIILSTIVVAGLSVAAVYGVKKLSAWMQSKRQLKQTNRMQRLSESRNAYLNNPSDPNLKKAYASALSKYNFKANLFGWADYDASNAWLNNPMDSDGSKGYSNSELLAPYYINKLAKLIKNDIVITPIN